MNYLSPLIRELSVALHYMRVNTRALASERASFAIMVIGMTINNCAFVFSWVLFASVYGAVNGWGVWQVLGLQGFIALAYGIAHSVFFGARSVRRNILNGSFDSVLLTPHSIIMRVYTLATSVTAFGDILFGVVCLSLFVYATQLPFELVLMVVSLIVPATLTFISVQLACSSIAFFMPDSDSLAQQLMDFIMFPGMFPGGAIQGGMRFLLTFIIPAFVVGILPVELTFNFSWSWYAIVWILAFLWFFISLFLFHTGLRHYESGNLTGARV